MRSNFQILPLLFIITITAHAQDDEAPSLNIGDPAPPLRGQEWLKGEPVQRFEKGMVYVVEFWATWCAPCKAAMPHLSDLAGKYKDRVTVIGVDIMEDKATTVKKVKAFVDSMGDRMDYRVVIQDSNFVDKDWMTAAGERGIPRSFVVNAEGRLAWIGHPSKLEEVLPKIVSNDWNITEVLNKRNLDRHLRELDDSLNYDLMNYRSNRFKPNDPGMPDSALFVINEIIRQEPKLKYAPYIVFNTFSSLLKTDLNKAYAYGKEAIVTATYEEPAYEFIYGNIEFYFRKLKLPIKFYQLGAEAYQAEIDNIIYPELANMPKRYNKMAEWYWRANNRLKAINAQQKAIQMRKGKKIFSKTDLAVYESRLQQYKKK